MEGMVPGVNWLYAPTPAQIKILLIDDMFRITGGGKYAYVVLLRVTNAS